MQPRPQHSSSRSGVVLLVVLTLLTLFAVVGLSFVLYANAAGRSAQLEREAGSTLRPDLDPELLFSYFLGQFIYDVPDDETGVFSALRGHSLARSMYGANTQGGNLVAYNGTGRLHTDGTRMRPYQNPFNLDDYHLLNYTYYASDGFVHDPERLARGGTAQTEPLLRPRGPYTGGFNAGYTYPDLNSAFLAALRASDGAVLLPSFHRPWAGKVQGQEGDFFIRDSNTRNPLWSSDTPVEQIPVWYKYTTLRPLPALNPGFPAPEDGGGDVKNFVGGPGTLRRIHNGTPEYWNNDSVWLDLGFPVMTAPDGRKYKPLFAALVTDLDNRLNVNVHGNALGANGEHRSNQGWGPWEVNLGKVLGPEAKHLVQGATMNPMTPAWEGRHGPDRQPTSRQLGNAVPATVTPHFYAQMDFDGRDELTGGSALPWGLPLSGGPRRLRSAFPYYGPGFGNANPGERTNHPALFDYFSPTRTKAGSDRTFAISNMEALLRYGDTGSPALTADLFRLCPTNFRNAAARGLITTHSYDLDQPGVPPWLSNPGSVPYTMQPASNVDELKPPEGGAGAFRALRERGRAPFDARLNRAEFGADWRSLISAMGRVNLNRPLPPYPHQGSGFTPPFGPPLTFNEGGQIVLDKAYATSGPIWAQFLAAQTARQKLAEDLYRRLLVVTGIPPIQSNPQEPQQLELRERRWLAQLAANIVDYIDEDDISTPFNFYTAVDSPLQPPELGRVDPERREGFGGEIQWPLYWVFGTELPRVVVNEAMAHIGVNDPGEVYRDTVRLFVELHNTFPRQIPPGTYQPDSFPVPLRMQAPDKAYSPYRVMVGTKRLTRPAGGDRIVPLIRADANNDNVLGNPEFVGHPDREPIRTTTTDADFAGPMPVPAGGTQVGAAPGNPFHAPLSAPFVPPHGLDTPTLSQGFTLLGPPYPGPNQAFTDYDALPRNPQSPTPVLRTANLQYTWQFLDEQEFPDERELGLTVVLRRLANPYLPFNGQRSADGLPNPRYNPYITVDYLEDIPLIAVGDYPPEIVSRGKSQPYAAHRSHLQDQVVGLPPVKHSFGHENFSTLDRFHWLTHLDRPLTSPLELLNVSDCQPYQLTQRFMMPNQRYAHRTPWLDEDLSEGGTSHRLYRLFDFIATGTQAAGTAVGGRIPGKINLNTVWDPEVLRALADAQPSNHFTEAEVNNLFDTLLYNPSTAALTKRRTQGAIPGPTDRPFWGLGMGDYSTGGQFNTLGGIEDTVLRLRSTGPDDRGHPALQHELLTKLFNHLTTRSNVFAVWLTVGFFEVTNDTVRPVKLGAELGRAENRQVRHRMFAILDRTNLSIASNVATLTQPVVVPVPLPAYPELLEPTTVLVSAFRGTTELAATGPTMNWEIKRGDSIVVGVGADQEVVEVLETLEVQPPPPLPPRLLPAIRAVFTRAHPLNTPIALAQKAGAPPIFLKPTKVTGQVPTYTVFVAVNPERSAPDTLAGEYDGIPWKIRAGTKLLIDVGRDQEAVEVQRVFRPNEQPDEQPGTRAFQIAVTRPHPGDFLITNTLLGNPGPRPRFNPRDPAYSGVVRYLSVIQ